MGPRDHFLEIPIYRISQVEFAKQYDRDVTKHVELLVNETPLSSDQIDKIRGIYAKEYGGPWQYNQAVGWLRLFVLGSQIRGDLWMSSRERYMRRSTRDFGPLVGDYFNVPCSRTQSSAEIRDAVESELLEFERSYRNGRLVLDLECFHELADHIDWRNLLNGAPS